MLARGHNMSLVEVVQTPSGEEFCVEAYAAHSIGGSLNRPEEPPGEWRIDVFRWPVSLRGTTRWSTVLRSKADAERRMEGLIALLEAGRWSPRRGDPLSSW